MYNPGSRRDGRKRQDTLTDNEVKLKVVILGDISVGKTALSQRFVMGTFGDKYRPTIGASFISKAITVQDEMIMLQIWDTAGQERYKSLVPMYLRGANAAILVYDVSDKESFHNVNKWFTHLENHDETIPIALVGNKTDQEAEVDQQIAQNYANAKGMMFFLTSAKTGNNVEKLFRSLGVCGVEAKRKAEMAEYAGTLMNQRYETKLSEPAINLDKFQYGDENGKQAKKGCCKS